MQTPVKPHQQLFVPVWQYLIVATCYSCLAGKYSSDNAIICTDCAKGRYSSIKSSACIACAAGTYQAALGQSQCTQCAKGTWSAATTQMASSTCTNCAAGQYAWLGASACTNCSVGRYQASSTSSLCTACEVGKFIAATAATECNVCPTGYFQARNCVSHFSHLFGAAVRLIMIVCNTWANLLYRHSLRRRLALRALRASMLEARPRHRPTIAGYVALFAQERHGWSRHASLIFVLDNAARASWECILQAARIYASIAPLDNI